MYGFDGARQLDDQRGAEGRGLLDRQAQLDEDFAGEADDANFVAQRDGLDFHGQMVPHAGPGARQAPVDEVRSAAVRLFVAELVEHHGLVGAHQVEEFHLLARAGFEEQRPRLGELFGADFLERQPNRGVPDTKRRLFERSQRGDIVLPRCPPM